MVKEIQLTQGKVALVDDEDFEHLNQWRWYAHKDHSVKKDSFYAMRKHKQQPMYMHRFIVGAEKGLIVDHMNHNGLDNRRENLRICTPAQNCQNQQLTMKIGKTSPYKGVRFLKRRNDWYAVITVNRKQLYLGAFKTEIEAAEAYNDAAILYHKEFARLNIIEENERLRNMSSN